MEYFLRCTSSWHPQELLEAGASEATSVLLLKSKDVKNEPDDDYNKTSLEDLIRDECICKVCFKEFISPAHLEKHSAVHVEVEVQDKPYKCQQCDKTFTSNSGLWRHTKKHNEEPQYKCILCDKSFSRKPSLQKHVETHKRDDKVLIKCEICARPFDCQYNFDRHMKIHTAKEPHTCEVCGKTFSNKSNLKTHMKKHMALPYDEMSTIVFQEQPSDERNFKCDSCDKTFKSKHYLKEHARIHTDKNPYKCMICDKQLSCKANLMVHVRTHIRKGTSIPAVGEEDMFEELNNLI